MTAQKRGLGKGLSALIPAIIRQAGDQEALEIALIENIQRENLNPIEESRGYERLMREFSLVQEAVSKKVGRHAMEELGYKPITADLR